MGFPGSGCDGTREALAQLAMAQLRCISVIIRIGGGAVVEPEASRTLEECLARIRQLEEENAHLREAAKTFGDLAERLKRALDAEMRRADHAGGHRDRSPQEAGRAGLAK